MKLLLFDIDGTLIRSNRAGRMAMAAALEEMFGTAGPLDEYPMSGKTDARILTDLLLTVGFDEAVIQARLPALYELMALKAEVIYPGKDIAPCPGVEPLLAALRARSDVLLGLLTGNAQPTAALKLGAAGIDPAQFRVGVYGSEALDRNQLPALALRRAAGLTGRPFSGADMVIIGDTPADILCARAGKATAVAVASGWHSAETLAQYNPDILLDDLMDTKRVLDELLRVREGK